MSGSSASSHAGFSKLKFRNSTLELLNDILECQIGWPGKEKKNIKVWKMRGKVRDLNILGKSSTTHYSRFGVRLSIIRKNMNSGFWKFFWVQIIAEYMYFHMVYHTFIENHLGWHRSVLNKTHFQLFAWFGKILLVKKILEKSKFLLVHTIAPKTNSQWSSWVWTRS